MRFEEQFRKAHHPLWAKAFDKPQPPLRRQKRLALDLAAMTDEDDEALKPFAEGFQSLRVGAFACIFWQTLREGEWGGKLHGGDKNDDEITADRCLVM
jgi:hypothetical protein